MIGQLKSLRMTHIEGRSIVELRGLILNRLPRLSMPFLSRAVSYVIGSVAAFWTIERVAAFAA